MSQWPDDTIHAFAASNDLHVAPFRPDGVTPGTPTWVWSVVVDDRLFVRPWHGLDSRWYGAAIKQRAGQITVDGVTFDVNYAQLRDAKLSDRIDAAYSKKYADSHYLAPMIDGGPKEATVEITLA